ncbi:helix-turn-helix transcriptional regulator [Micromonospora sp. WMMD1155]|uniref:PadR family transcriptional regulator n=1 Tax=Micromonospora sp. WMMD1155 TaxID=3016094 RepID=UPI00249CA831|nr:helix-turn-helix transcriptional regulator [Micromonospora sp. WMMD1155]WFE48835.1 helix-turn-helix transcriptional regulator [Micromonospora sp. WMMD1155]
MSDGPARITGPLLAVLNALLDADDNELHGWAIMKATGKGGPTVYKILERLNESKWVTSRWEDDAEPGKPRRRYYKLTPHGVSSARALIATRQPKPAPTVRTRLAFGWCQA